MKNPYDSLGVPKDASPDQIKSAYRKKARKTHPDKGGSTEAFQEVSRAYAVLADPHKREHYDRTGNEAKPEDNVLLQEIAALFLNVIDNVPDVTTISVVAQMEQAIRHGIKQRQQLKEQAVRDIGKRETVLARVTHGDHAENVLADILTSDIAQRRQRITQFDLDIIKGERMLEVLSEYQYKVDEMKVFVPTHFHHGYTSASTSL